MNEAEYMRRQGQLLTEKQYKKSLISVIAFILLALLTVVAGFVIAIVAEYENVFITGFIVGAIGFTLFLISLVFAFKNWPKIMLYRHYKKHPEDYENEV